MSNVKRRILAVTKSNLALEAPAIACCIDGSAGAPRVQWLGTTEHTASQLVAERSDGEDGDGRAEARQWLTAELAEGPRPVRELKSASSAAGVSWRTVERAKRDLGARARKLGQPGSATQAWAWELLPKTANPASKAATHSELAVVGASFWL